MMEEATLHSLQEVHQKWQYSSVTRGRWRGGEMVRNLKAYLNYFISPSLNIPISPFTPN